MQNYLIGCYQKVNSFYTSWSEMITGVPQGSILGQPLFHIFLNYISFYPKETFLSICAIDNTLYAIGNAMNNVKH